MPLIQAGGFRRIEAEGINMRNWHSRCSTMVPSLTSSTLHRFQPLNDARWNQFLHDHPHSSVFHTTEWLDSLRRTYGYEPIALTSTPPEKALRSAVVFCRVQSWITGHRLVALPFSDHCSVLLDNVAGLSDTAAAVDVALHEDKVQYVELRSTNELDIARLGAHSTHTYCLHTLDLRPSLDALFKKCHRDSTQRKIHRAEQSGLGYEEGRSTKLLDSFYRLLILTRRRHNMPPQPRRWFQNLAECFGAALKVRAVFRGQQPVAAILTLQHKDTLVYKYGCSDAQFHRFGGMQLLFWRSIQEAKQEGLQSLDFGRTDWNNTGLLTFKDRWGATRSSLTYGRFFANPKPTQSFMSATVGWKQQLAQKVFPHLPDRLFCLAGDLLYRHMG